ncbi:MAG: Fic family protein [Crocinitomicaceae bacterium]|nr:Fic family protein [Flavobacteriales bacterium]NQZ36788.1 Fic family protein [Crocinitomicaceae bacterium]
MKKVVKGESLGFPARKRDQIEVSNYFMALEFLELELEKGTPFSEDLVQRIHGFILRGSKRPSNYREDQNQVSDGTGRVVYMPPEAKDVELMMVSLVRWVNEEIEYEEIPAPVIAGLLHYQLATIHPYYDGNGRTARLLTTYVLHKTGYGMQGIYSLEEYYAKNLSGYYRSLDTGPSHNYYFGREEADVTPFLDYFLGGMAESFRKVRNRADELQKEHEQRKTSALPSRDIRELGAKERHSLSLFLRQKEVSSNDVANHLGIPKRSALHLLKKWIDKDFVKIIDQSRKTRTYGLTTEWELLIEQQRMEERKQKLANMTYKKRKQRGAEIER